MNKVVTSVKLPATLEQAMLRQIIEDGYGMRGKSRWITEAIQRFLALPGFFEMVNIATDLQQLNKVISIRLPANLVTAVEEALVEVRQHYPEMEGVKSNIIRASIMQRLLREK